MSLINKILKHKKRYDVLQCLSRKTILIILVCIACDKNNSIGHISSA